MKVRARKGSFTFTWLMGTGMFLLTCLAVFLVFWLVLERAMEPDVNRVPFSLHSLLSANYQADPRGLRAPVVELGLIDSVVRDLESTNRPPGTLLATLIANLQTPVPTVTPAYPDEYGATPTPASLAITPTPQVANDATVTPTPGGATPTQSLTLTPAATASPTMTTTWLPLTLTPVIINPTVTSVHPTQPRPTYTSTPSTTREPQPTPTQPPPTATVPPPTATALPPTPTPRPPTATQRPPPTSTPRPYPGPTTPPYP